MNVDFQKAKPYYARRHGKWTRISGYTSKPRKLKLAAQGRYGKRVLAAMDKKRLDVRMALGIAEEVKKAGGQALIVGGFVRDALLGRSNKDIDIEVYKLNADQISTILSKFGKVNPVGASFGILKVSHPDLDYEIDVSNPRRESKVGEGHRKGILAEPDPSMTIREAARRRDFTVNSMAYDPLTKVVYDEFGGIRDLEAGILRATDPMTFGDDTLRVMRAMRFAGRLGFTIDKDTLSLCRTLNLSDLSKERLFGEFANLFTAQKPSQGLKYFADLGLEKLFPDIGRLRETQQDPHYHPEGNAWDHTMMVVDEAAKLIKTFEDPKKFIIFMFSALLHDIGKPDTTYRSEQTGHIVSPGHAEQGEELTRRVMGQLTAEPDVIDEVVSLVREHLQPTNLYQGKARDSAVRRLALRVDIPTLVKLSKADKLGRGAKPDPYWMNLDAEKWLLEKYKNLSLDKPNTLKPLVMGRHLIELGVEPGVGMGRILKKLFEAQLDGKFSTTEGGIELARQEGLLPEIVKSKRVFVPQSPKHKAYWRFDPRTKHEEDEQITIYRGMKKNEVDLWRRGETPQRVEGMASTFASVNREEAEKYAKRVGGEVLSWTISKNELKRLLWEEFSKESFDTLPYIERFVGGDEHGIGAKAVRIELDPASPEAEHYWEHRENMSEHLLNDMMSSQIVPVGILAKMKMEANWHGFPLRKDIGQQPNERDVPPKVTSEGDFILYHGTSDVAANQIIQSRTVKPDDIGSVGIATIPEAAETYATHKIGEGSPTILELTISKDWLIKQELRHEIGGHGHSAFLINPNYKLGIKATIPPEAIKNIKIYGRDEQNVSRETLGEEMPEYGSPAPPLVQYSDMKELGQIYEKEYMEGEIKDPLGDKIDFTHKNFLHITKLDTGQADKYRCERLLWIKDIIQNPDLILKDRRDPKARLFLKWYHGEPYLFVCRVENGQFHSVTAYPLENPGKLKALLGQEQIYSRPGFESRKENENEKWNRIKTNQTISRQGVKFRPGKI